MSGFPNLKPFATCLASIEQGIPIGTLNVGGSQVFVNVTSAALKTEPGIEPALNSTAITGNDWIYCDPDGEHLRLDVRILFKTDDGDHINLSYNGIITVNEEVGKVFTGAPDAKSVGFGQVFSNPKFSTGSEKYKHLENHLFVAGGRFLVSEKGVQVEYKISQVIA